MRPLFDVNISSTGVERSSSNVFDSTICLKGLCVYIHFSLIMVDFLFSRTLTTRNLTYGAIMIV